MDNINMDDIFDDLSDEDNELLEDNSKTKEIDGLSVRRDALNKALNLQFRYIFKELATETNPLPDNFCCGISEPDAPQIEYMKNTIFGNQIDDDSKHSSADNSLSGVIFDKMKDVDFSKSYFKSIKNGVNHLLVMIGLPKILDGTKHLYPRMMKVYGNWAKHVKENPVKSKQAAIIESGTLHAMKIFVPRNDWELMAQFYVTNAVICGQRGIEAQHQLMTENLVPVESKLKKGPKGKKGEKDPRYVYVMVVYVASKNGTEYFETVTVCSCPVKFSKFTSPCLVGCSCGIAKRFRDRLVEAEVVNVYPGLPKPRSTNDQSKCGMFNEKHMSPDSHTGIHTLPKLFNALNDLLPAESRSSTHFTGHSGKQTHIDNAFDAGISPELVAITTNSSLPLLLKEYGKGKGLSTKIQNSITLTSHLDDTEPASKNDDKEPAYKKTKTSSTSFPMSSSPEKDNSQSTSDSVIIARHKQRQGKENKKRGSTGSSSSSSNSNQYQLPPNPQNQLPHPHPHPHPQPSKQVQHPHPHPQGGHAPVFNFYTNYNPNP